MSQTLPSLSPVSPSRDQHTVSPLRQRVIEDMNGRKLGAYT